MGNLNLTLNQAMDALNIQGEDRNQPTVKAPGRR